MRQRQGRGFRSLQAGEPLSRFSSGSNAQLTRFYEYDSSTDPTTPFAPVRSLSTRSREEPVLTMVSLARTDEWVRFSFLGRYILQRMELTKLVRRSPSGTSSVRPASSLVRRPCSLGVWSGS